MSYIIGLGCLCLPGRTEIGVFCSAVQAVSRYVFVKIFPRKRRKYRSVLYYFVLPLLHRGLSHVEEVDVSYSSRIKSKYAGTFTHKD